MAASIDLSSISHSFGTPCQLEDDGVTEHLIAAIPEKVIFGRIEETISLLEAYQRLLRTKQPQTIVVHGKSGSGKTALVDTLLRPVFDTNGYFVVGKFFQNEAVQEPFSAIMAAFSDLCDLVVQSDDFDELKQDQIVNALDVHAPLLAKAITNFSSLIGTINGIELEVSSSIIKFKTACKAFLHALASDDHPIVIFLDDIQWAEEGSVALIQMFLQDVGLRNVMLVLAYRDEESEYVEDIIYHARDPIDIALLNLDSDAVSCMVTSIMQANTEEIQLLSNLVAKRTSGNPFHVAMFLDTIEHEGLLVYASSTSSWLFDVDEIRQAIMVSETLADLLTRKIGRISDDIKHLLKVASLLGYQFEESILRSIICTIAEKKLLALENSEGITRWDPSTATTLVVVASLSEAVTEGFIEKTNDGYQFTHDKLQSAFQSLIDDSEENKLHKLIGETFLKFRSKERSYIYKAAVHLNRVPFSLECCQERARLARINLDAAKYCVEISAFGRATVALEHGLNCLIVKERWSEEYSPLTFEIMEALARNQFIIGEFEDCKETITEALCHSIPTETKVKFQVINVDARMTGNEVEESHVASFEALKTLEINMPRKVKTRHVLAKMLKVKWMLKNKTDEDILNLPLTRNPLISQSVKLLVKICSHYLLREQKETGIWATLVAVEITLNEGLSLLSPGAFTFYGIAELVVGNRAGAYRFGKLALAMLDRMESREADCTTIGTAMGLLIFRRSPLQELVEPLSEAATVGFRYGDISYATHCILQSHKIDIILGTNLAILEKSMRKSYAIISEIGQDGLLLYLQPPLQHVLNMQVDVTNWDNISTLSGEIMDETAFLDGALERNDTVLVVSTISAKARIACDFGQFELAASCFDTMAKHFGNDAITYSYRSIPHYWDVARTHLSLYGSSGQRRHLRQARKYMKYLQRLATDGCSEASVRLIFLEAQEASVRKRPLGDASLRNVYLQAFNQLADGQYFHLEGLLNENAGFDFAKRGLRVEAKLYFDRALYIYEHEWGSRAKYNQLVETMFFWTESERVNAHQLEETMLSGLCIDISP